MALNPQLYGNGMPVAFVGEMFVLARDGVEFEVDKIPGSVVPEGQPRALYSTHSFKILFKEGGCGTFIPLFVNLIASMRQYSQHFARSAPVLDSTPCVDPLQAVQTPVEEMMRQAYVDLSDPTKIFLQQPTSKSQLRRRAYHSQAVENSI